MHVPPYVTSKGAYGADQTEKVGAFRAEISLRQKLYRTGKNAGVHSEKKWVLLKLIELKT